MVSQLSARLLAGGTPRQQSEQLTSAIQKHDQNGSDSGYSADRDSSENESPSLVGFHVKHRIGVSGEEIAKRRKLNEGQFKAFFARADLKRAGLAVPKVRADNPRAIPLAKLDMSSVKLVFSNTIANSPFLVPEAGQAVFDVNAGQTYMDLVRTCRHAYMTSINQQRNADSDAESSTSSVSETDSDDEQNASPIMVVDARIEDARDLKHRVVPVHTTQIEVADNHLVSCPPSMAVSLEEALAFCQNARLMVLSTLPYTVIHSNAAFSRLTGIPSSSILGKNLADLVDGSASQMFSLPSCVASSGAGRDTIVDFKTQGDKEDVTNGVISCTINVQPIKSGLPKDHGNLENDDTHFVVDLTALSGDNLFGHVGGGAIIPAQVLG